MLNQVGLQFLESISLDQLQTEASAIRLVCAAENEFQATDVTAEYLDKPQDLDPILSDPWSAEMVSCIWAVWTTLEMMAFRTSSWEKVPELH